jgi:hypothetical protein
MMIAIATALGALTAGAATHLAATLDGNEPAEFLVSGSLRAVSAMASELRVVAPHASPRLSEIDLPELVIRPERRRLPSAVAQSQPPCRHDWRPLVTGPDDRRVRPLCPSEIGSNARADATNADASTVHASNELQRLQVPHAFAGDHLIESSARLP